MHCSAQKQQLPARRSTGYITAHPLHQEELALAAAPTCVEVCVRVLIHFLVLQDVVRHLRPNGRLHIQPLQRDHGAGGLHVGGEPQAGQETENKPSKTSAPFLGRNPPLQAAQPLAGLTLVHRDEQTDPQGQGAQGESRQVSTEELPVEGQLDPAHCNVCPYLPLLLEKPRSCNPKYPI